jgi:hypothetical protein
MVVAALCATGCGPTPNSFKGVWTYSSGALSTTCTVNGQPAASNSEPKGNEVLSGGTDTDLVLLDPSGCNLKLDVAGNQATAVPGQSCTVTNNNVTTVLKFISYQLTLGADQKSYAEAFNVSATQSGPGGSAECVVNGNGQLTKTGG